MRSRRLGPSDSAVDPGTTSACRRGPTPGTAICLAVDRSGSMGGRPLATAAVAAAAVAWRSPEDYSVLSFGKEVIAAKSQDLAKSNEAVVDAVLALRGFGTTDVAGALTAAAEQLGRSRAGRKITVLLSDCRRPSPVIRPRRGRARRTDHHRSRVRCRRGRRPRDAYRRSDGHRRRPERCRPRPEFRARPLNRPMSRRHNVRESTLGSGGECNTSVGGLLCTRFRMSVCGWGLAAVAAGSTHAVAAREAGFGLTTLRTAIREHGVGVLRQRTPRAGALTIEDRETIMVCYCRRG